MIIDNPEALKTWLTKILQPLCDADPSTLARYVFALLKKEKTVKELKKSMNEQLQVFLVDETKSFVERLFQAIQTEEYLLPSNNKNLSIHEAELLRGTLIAGQSDREVTPPIVQNILDTKEIISKTINKINPLELETPHNLATNVVQTSSVILSPQSSSAFSPIKASTDKENIPRELRRRRASARSKSRSRSRSNDRMSRRSKSRDRRAVEREKQSKIHRNKSPPILEKRKGERKIIEDRMDHNNKNKNFNRSRSRSRSNSIEHYKISPPNSPVRYENKKPRCRDFDEKGYCIRGEKCLCDHGSNPVVLEGINNSTLLSIPPHLREYNPDSPEIWNRGAIGSTFSGPRTSFSSNKTLAVSNAYQRTPGPGSVAGFRPVGGNFPFLVNSVVVPVQRELIPVPVVDANSGAEAPGPVGGLQQKRRYDPDDAIINEGPIKRKLPINSRLGPRVGSSNSQQNCSLELRKIPRGLNTIAHLNNHFSKFGKIVNIKISYDGDPEAAIITFSTHAEANVAYRSTEAVLNNRFIKVFWHMNGPSDGSNNNQNNAITKDETGNNRKNSIYHINNMPPTPIPVPAPVPTEGPKEINPNASTENQCNTNAILKSASSGATTVPTINTSTVSPQPIMRMKTTRNIASNALIRKKQEEQAHAVVQLAHGLQKRKSELIQEYLKEMKSVVDILERIDQNDPQRNKMLETIKNLQSNIDKLNKELATEQAQIAAHIQIQAIPGKKSKEQQKKELLDIELELIAQQQEGNDTSAIQKRLEDLQRTLGVSTQKHFNNNISGNATTRINRIRATGPQGSTSIDRRPKTLLITGFNTEDAELLLGHFKHFGEITKHEIEKSIPQILITYATRSIAEQAAIRGQVYKDKKLKISWALPQPVSLSKQPSAEDEKMPLTEKTDCDLSTEKLPELRLEDEDEDEEERSWRK